MPKESTKRESKNIDAPVSADQAAEDFSVSFSPADFETDAWIGKIYTDPKKLGIYEKTMCFHNLDGRGNPTSANDSRIFTYLCHTQHIFVCGGIPYIYDGGYYHEDLSGAKLQTLIRHCLLQVFVKSTTIKRIFNLFLTAEELQKAPEEMNDYPGRYINFENGMYDPIRQKVYAHEPKIYSTNQVPHTYDPSEDHGTGIEIEKYLNYAVPNPEDREMLLQYIGLCCTKDTSQQKMLIMCGKGGTGKSTMINLIQDIVGKRNVSNVAMSELSQRFAAIAMMGKLLNACADLEIDALDDVTMIKKLIGEDSIKGEHKGKDIISFDNYAKLLFSTNELPIVRNEKTDGFYRRLLILTMDNKPAARDPLLKNKLEEELPYLIHLAMEALHRMYERGSILASANSDVKIQQLRNDSDTVEAYLSEHCVSDPKGKIERKELYDNYTDFCKDWDRQAHQKLSFFKALRNKGFTELKTNGTVYFRGLRYKNETEDGFMKSSENVDSDIPFDA